MIDQAIEELVPLVGSRRTARRMRPGHGAGQVTGCGRRPRLDSTMDRLLRAEGEVTERRRQVTGASCT